ncbi:hypothetical protein TEA_005245 [Camellia sinensis var. sinensis]|uniref:Alpha/beta hydrolase fold-3 domain-containing protein n=1 Tax=Camellia sinensis var. sinensis TaxID=542762 RepID=A0A4S4DTN8_CAMSN|nr:hypothetical protein TEA_005245 [Camellia sinensis var. sinensis]
MFVIQTHSRSANSTRAYHTIKLLYSRFLHHNKVREVKKVQWLVEPNPNQPFHGRSNSYSPPTPLLSTPLAAPTAPSTAASPPSSTSNLLPPPPNPSTASPPPTPQSTLLSISGSASTPPPSPPPPPASPSSSTSTAVDSSTSPPTPKSTTASAAASLEPYQPSSSPSITALAPEHRFPSQFVDALDALKFLDDAVLPPIADLSRCFITGDSAGANIAHHAAVRAAEEEFRRVKIAGVIAVQPFFGGEKRTESELRLARVPLVSTEITDWLWRAFLPEKSDRNHEVVNVSGPKSASISGVKFPATMVVVGGFDPLQDRQRRYHGWLKKCGVETCLVEYPNAVHAFYWFPELPESSMLIRDVRDFIQKHE